MRDRVFWLVGPGKKLRHAVRVHPAALPHGEFIPTVCETWIRVPFSTPYDRIPASKAITERCADCVYYLVQQYRESSPPMEISWDS